MPSEFHGILAEVDAARLKEQQGGAPPAPAVPAPPTSAAPVEPAPPVVQPVETPPPEETPAEQAATPKPADTPAAPGPGASAAEIRKWKMKLKVAGVEEDVEIGEDALDGRDPAKQKWLIDQLQRSKDYDRPGGALDKLATRKAQADSARWLVENGLAEQGADGRLTPTPAYAAWQAQQAAAAAAPPAPAKPAEPTVRQKRIDELQAKYDDPAQSITGAEMREFQKLVSDEQFDTRLAEAQAESRKVQENAARLAAETRAKAEAKKRADDGDKEAYEAIDKDVAGLTEKYRNPLTKEIDAQAVADARAIMQHTLETNWRSGMDPATCWEKARERLKQHAEGHSARLTSIIAKAPKVATAAPPAPIARGQAGPAGATEDKDDHDYSKPFTKQKRGGLAEFERKALAART